MSMMHHMWILIGFAPPSKFRPLGHIVSVPPVWLAKRFLPFARSVHHTSRLKALADSADCVVW